jgi:phage terminase large subunit-like protein
MNMSPPSKEFERIVRSKRMNHGGNPVLRWMLQNCVPYTDFNENLKIRKMKETRGAKIDGIVAAIIALGEYLKNPQPEVYSQTGLFYV